MFHPEQTLCRAKLRYEVEKLLAAVDKRGRSVRIEFCRSRTPGRGNLEGIGLCGRASLGRTYVGQLSDCCILLYCKRTFVFRASVADLGDAD